MFFIQINVVNISVINVPASTGGWYNWRDVTIPNVEISNGDQFIRLQIVQGGFNIESITFETVLNTTSDDIVVKRFSVEKAYPNPFNNEIKIPITSNGQELVSAKIYNLKGEFITNIANDIISEGKHVLSWKGINNKNKNVPSGTYLLIIDNEATFHSQKVILLK